MKKSILSLFIILGIGIMFSLSAKSAEAKSYGYRSSYKSFSSPSYSSRNYNYGGQLRHQRGYYKPSTGTYVQPHFKTGPDNYKWNNRKSLYGW